MRPPRPSPWLPWLPWSCATVVLAMGCTRVSDRSRFEGPDEFIEILTSTPRPGALDVPPTVRIDLCMSDHVDPRSPGEGDAHIGSGNSTIDAEMSVQIVPWMAPGSSRPPEDRSAPWCEGSVISVQPRAPLQPGARHRLRLRPTLTGWAGQPLSTDGPLWVTETDGDVRYALEFTVDPQPPGDPLMPMPEPEPVTLHDLFDAGGPLDPSRPLCSCHRDPDDLALARLDLSEPTAAFEDLLGSSRPRDTGFAMVAPRDPSQSFLVHKLLRDADDQALHGVLGEPMPPDEPMPYDDLLAIIAWIEDGAQL